MSDSLIDLDDAIPKLWRDDDLAAMFRHQLATPLEFDLGQQMPQVLRDLRTSAEGAAAACRTFRQILLDDATGVVTPDAVLEAIKNYGKSLGRHRDSVVPREIGKLLYFCAIAAARVRSGTQISDLPSPALESGLRWAMQQPWIDDPSRQLLAAAMLTIRDASGQAKSP